MMLDGEFEFWFWDCGGIRDVGMGVVIEHERESG